MTTFAQHARGFRLKRTTAEKRFKERLRQALNREREAIAKMIEKAGEPDRHDGFAGGIVFTQSMAEDIRARKKSRPKLVKAKSLRAVKAAAKQAQKSVASGGYSAMIAVNEAAAKIVNERYAALAAKSKSSRRKRSPRK